MLETILSIPAWQHRSYWHMLIEGEYFKPFVKKVLVSNPTYVSKTKSSMFSGKKGFFHVYLLIETKKCFYTRVPNILHNAY